LEHETPLARERISEIFVTDSPTQKKNSGALSGCTDFCVGVVMLNGVALTIMTVPEPQTWMVLGGGLAALVLALRRKRLPNR
jgi:hypothetical protein